MAVGREAVLARSPLGTGVVAAWNTKDSSRAIVVDARTGRVVRRYTEVGGSAVYWLGGELPARARDAPFLLAEDAGVCWSRGCGTEYSVVGSGFSEGWEAETVAVLRKRLVVDFGDGLGVFGPPADPTSELSVREIRLQGSLARLRRRSAWSPTSQATASSRSRAREPSPGSTPRAGVLS